MENETDLDGAVCPAASFGHVAETGDAPEGGRNYVVRRSNASKLRAEREAEGIDHGKPQDVIHVREYNRGNWFTSSGVLRKRREIEAKGLPSFNKWRFLTLTIDPEQFDHDPLRAFLLVKDRLRHFFGKMRDAGLMHDSGKWCWKLEFQENGWPHWHVLYDWKAKYSEGQLAEIRELWGFGRTNVEMVSNDDFLYSFKYAFKPVQCVEDADLFDFEPAVAPAWFLDYQGEKAGRKVSFARCRFWQTSRNFYTNAKPAKEREKREPKPPKDQEPARVRAERIRTTVQAVARKASGKYIASAVVALTCATGTLWHSVAWDTLHGYAVGLSVNNYVIPTSTLEKHTQPLCKKLQHLRSVTRLSLAKAQRLARAGTPLRTC